MNIFQRAKWARSVQSARLLRSARAARWAGGAFRQGSKNALSLARYDLVLLVTVVALLSFGLVMVYSVTIGIGGANSGAGAGEGGVLINPMFRKQLVHIALGVGLAGVVASLQPEWLQQTSRAFLALGLLLLVAVLLPGVGLEVNGSLRWLGFGGLRLQPSEFVKIAAVVYFADYFSRKREHLHHFRVGVINVGLVVGVICCLLILEPDFGATAVLATSVVGMMFLAGVRFWHFVASLGTAGAVLIGLLWMAPYRVQRLSGYRTPWEDPFNSGFQLVQALIAIGRGEWFGVGLGSSIQKLAYLPHANNDFLIAVIGEELGVMGIFVILLLFLLVLWRAFAIARRALAQGDWFAGLLAQGLGLLIVLQAAIHVGVNTGLLPTKGLTLPLMSYGGSSMLGNMLAVGLLFSIDRYTRRNARGRQCSAS